MATRARLTVDVGRLDRAGERLTGDLTVQAWVKLAAKPFPNRDTNWFIMDAEDYPKAGWMLRVDGETVLVK